MNKRHIEKRISLIPESTINNTFIDDPEYLFLLKKTEKIIMATYILSDFIPQQEGLKKTLKDNSYEALDAVCNLLSDRTQRLDSVQKIKATFIKLLTQYSLANISGFISRMNTQIIKDEIDNLLRTVGDLERELLDEQATDFKQSYFGVDVRNKRQYSIREQGTGNREQEKETVGVIKDKTKTNVLYKNTLNTGHNASIGATEDREQKVIEIIKDKKNVSIKDISENILNCSEKTIQRTLNKLISDGKVLKKGERRWARYELV